MDTDGYLVFPKLVNPTSFSKSLEPYRKKTEYIFNGSENDHKRKQVTIPGSLVKQFREAILKLPLLTKHHSVDHFVLLRSLPGCQRQLAHTDYVPDDEFLQSLPEERPLLCVLALEEKTKLVVWPRSQKVICGRGRSLDPIHPRVVWLEPGDALVFRGDLVHAGAEYESENIRLHCYIDSQTVKRYANRTFIIQKHANHLIQEKIVE
jgi:hypothetical protein